MNLTYLCVVINSYNSCMIHGDCRVITILGFRSVTNTLLSLFHNALDHNDSSALPGHFTRISPREVTWQGGAVVMVQCIMKQVNPAFGRNQKSIRITSLIPAFLVRNNSITLVKTHTKNLVEWICNRHHDGICNH